MSVFQSQAEIETKTEKISTCKILPIEVNEQMVDLSKYRVADSQVRQVYEPMLPQFKKVVQHCQAIGQQNPVDIFWALEDKFGEWFAEKACRVLKIDDGACIVNAIVMCLE